MIYFEKIELLIRFSVASGNFPFTTIEPNIGVAYVKADCACKHFDIQHENELCINGTRLIPVKLLK